MSHDATTIFRQIVGGIQQGISIYDIQYVLGCGRPDIGGLITYGRVNPFAKYKPVRDNTLGVLTDARRLLALWGVAMTECGRVDYKDYYNVPWGYNRPRGKGGGSQGYDEWFRILDFDGYQHYRWPEVKTAGRLTTIFNAQMTIPGASVAALDTIVFDMQCRENDDADAYLNLLYPYDFIGAVSPYDISAYYMGIAIIDNINAAAGVTRNVFVISGPHISDYFQTQGYHLYASMRAQIPDSVTNGAIIIAPVLLQNHTIQSGQSEPSWTNGYNGTIVNLNGAYFATTKFADNNNIKITFNNITIGASSFSFSVTVQNRTGDLVTMNNLIGYLLSDASEMNEHANGYSGNPDYYGMGAGPYVKDLWPDYVQHDIHTHDWTGNAETIDELGARYINLLSLFVAANGGSRDLGNGNSVTFQVSLTQGMVVQGNVGDDFGPYSEGAWLYVGLHAGNFNVMRQEQLI